MRVLLVDADIIAYQTAARFENKFDFTSPDGTAAVACDEEAATSAVNDIIEGFMRKLKADHVVVCLTDPDHNFRLDLLPSYKSNRKDTVRPQMLKMLKQVIADTNDTFIRPTLEADDVMGILLTNKTLWKKRGWTDVIQVSEDKDQRTVAGKLYNPNRPELGVITVSEIDALRFLLWQTICGDQTDGYTGCKGVGKSSLWAEAILEETDPLEMWDNVLCAYFSKGLTEKDALVQVRMANILKSHDWDYKNNKPILWTTANLLY